MTRQLRVLYYGNQLVKYSYALRLQEHLANQRKAGDIADTLVLLQHAPVYTIGKRGRLQDFKLPIEELQRLGIDVCNVPRGGEVTYHDPGQLVAYPILGLRDLGRGARSLVEGLEDALVDTVGTYGVVARGRVPGATGVWAGDNKIAAIGVKISGGISSHGVALNVYTDLSAFDMIVPCGITDKGVTSLKNEISSLADLGKAKKRQEPLGKDETGLRQAFSLFERAAISTRSGARAEETGLPLTETNTCHSQIHDPITVERIVAQPVSIQCDTNQATDTCTDEYLKLPVSDTTAMKHVCAVFLHHFCCQFGHSTPNDIVYMNQT